MVLFPFGPPLGGTSHLERRPTTRPSPGSFRWRSTRSQQSILEVGWLQYGVEQEMEDSSEEESDPIRAITRGNRSFFTPATTNSKLYHVVGTGASGCVGKDHSES